MITNAQGLTVTVDGDCIVLERDGCSRRESWPVLADLLDRLAQLLAQ